ncbi:hypothetical protein D3C71_1570120 [compost metagenome]
MFAEQVGFGLFAEGSLDNSCAGTADAFGISQADCFGIASSVLLDCDQAGNAEAFFIGAAHHMARGFWSNQQHVGILRSHDLAEVNVEAVGEHQSRALLQVRFDFVLIYGSLCFVRHQNLYHIRTGYRFGDRQHFKAVVLRSLERLAFAEPDNDLQSAVAQVLCLGMPLAAVTDNRDRFTF